MGLITPYVIDRVEYFIREAFAITGVEWIILESCLSWARWSDWIRFTC